MTTLFRPLPLLLIAVVALVATASGCTLALDVDECSADDECVEQYGDGWSCTPDNICQPQCETDEDCREAGPEAVCGADNVCYTAQEGVPCETSQDCRIAFEDGWTCPEGGGLCEPPADAVACDEDDDCRDHEICNELNICQDADHDLLEEPCTVSAGDIDDDDAFIVGVLLPFTGEEAPFGEALFDAITLALADFNNVGGVDGRPVALLGCDTRGQNDLALEGAERLEELGVEAVIGPDWSDQTRETALEVTIDAEMTQVSPSATEAGLTELGDLLWRTATSDAIQGRALSELVNHLLAERPHYRDLEDDAIPEQPSLAILRREQDSWALGLREAITGGLPADFGDDQMYLEGYPNEAAGENPEYSSIAAGVISAATGQEDSITPGDFAPDVVVIIGSAEAWTLARTIDELGEEDFPNPPLFVFADAARVGDFAEDAPESLENRIWGTAPRNVADLGYQPYDTFRFRYQENFDRDPGEMQFVPHAFDALYVIGLGAAYGGFDGPGISEGIHQLRDGETVLPSRNELPDALDELSAGNSVNLDGASGPLNLDEPGDPEPKPTSLWCFQDGELPDEGVILDEDLEFTPRYCGIDYEEPECTNDDDCDGDQHCEPDDGVCVECLDDQDCDDPENGQADCQGGFCVTDCDESLEWCGGECVDTSTNIDHCGSCTNECGDDQYCQEGSCEEFENGDPPGNDDEPEPEPEPE